MTKPRIPRDPRAVELAQRAVAAHPDGYAGVARDLGVERPTLWRYLNEDDYSGVRLNAIILAKFGQVSCPHQQRIVHPDECRTKALTPQPFGGRARLEQWTACQGCAHKPHPHRTPSKETA